jgi:type IV pilus assembly protein PilC
MTSSSNKKIYRWNGINTLGKKIHGEIEADNKQKALSQLKNQPLLFLKMHEKKTFFISKKISPLLIVFFFRQLATLIGAGVPIVQSLILLNQMNPHVFFQKMIHTIKMDLESGKLLSVSLRQFSYFDHTLCHLIHVGEQSGTLEIILNRIAHHKEYKMHLKKKVIQSLFYPAIILSVALIISIIMLTFVVPHFAELFKTMHGKLPSLTLAVIALSHFIQNEYYIIFLLNVFFILVLKYARTLPFVKQKMDYFILTLPLVGMMISKILLAHFARYLAIALKAGIPIAQALKMITETMGNLFYEKIIIDLHAAVCKGQALNQALHKQVHFPILMTQMVKIGEESGTLEKMLEKIAEIYESDVEHLITQLANLLEPLIMIILGVLIGGIIIAMYLPIFKLGTLM